MAEEETLLPPSLADAVPFLEYIACCHIAWLAIGHTMYASPLAWNSGKVVKETLGTSAYLANRWGELVLHGVLGFYHLYLYHAVLCVSHAIKYVDVKSAAGITWLGLPPINKVERAIDWVDALAWSYMAYAFTPWSALVCTAGAIPILFVWHYDNPSIRGNDIKGSLAVAADLWKDAIDDHQSVRSEDMPRNKGCEAGCVDVSPCTTMEELVSPSTTLEKATCRRLGPTVRLRGRGAPHDRH